MATIDFKAKLKKLNDMKYEKLVATLPIEYSIVIQRQKPLMKYTEGSNGNWDENFQFAVDSEVAEHEFGPTLVFNHMLSIIDNMAAADDRYMKILKDYMYDELGMGEVDDSNFNK